MTTAINQNMDAVRMLTEMRKISEMAKSYDIQESSATTSSVSFGGTLKAAIDHVNQDQQAAQAVKAAYEMEDPSVSITDVMLKTKKAEVEFQALVKVHSKFIEFYKEIMNLNL